MAVGDLTGDGRPEAAVLLSCSPQPSNFYVEEVHAFEVPTSLPPGSLHDLLTIFLDPSHGKGGILHVVNDTGGSSTIANPDVPVTVVSYP